MNKFNGRCPESAIKIGEVQKDNNNNVELMYLIICLHGWIMVSKVQCKVFFFNLFILFYFIKNNAYYAYQSYVCVCVCVCLCVF